MLFIAFVSNGVLIEGVGPYLVGGLILACTVALLRNDTLPPFAEHFAVPGLLVGGATLGYGLDRDLGTIAAAVLMALFSLSIAALIRRNWLRVLLGGAACWCTLVALEPNYHPYGSFREWLAIHIVLGVWALAQWRGRKPCADTRRAALLECVALGWVLVTLAALAFSTGTTFLVEAIFWAEDFKNLAVVSIGITLLCSGALAACAGAWLVHCWPSLRQWWCGMAALVLVALASQMPPLGATLLVLAIFCAARRWRLAIAAGAAAAWIIGAFYYQFSIPLATKALMMAGAGALLAACSWWALRGQAIVLGSGAAPANSMLARIGIAVCALAVLAVVNVGIFQKETLIANGRPVFVELMPVDPRSLMQGDYMQLAFHLPMVARANHEKMAGAERVRAVGTIAPRGVLTLDHLADGAPLAPEEMAVELTPHGDSWMLATDAWYFKEGEAKRWASARYGEFRVDASGRALLTGLRGPALEPL